MMDMFEKAEKLQARANVTFEEAKAALENCGGDLLDAMVYLEKQGKVHQPEQSTYSTSYDQQEKYTSVEEKVNAQKKNANVFEAIRSFVRGFIDKCRGNYLYISKDEEEKFKLPVLAAVVLFIAFWHTLLPVAIVMLFLGFHFSFHGKDELEGANDFMDKASDLANQVKEGFLNSRNASEEESTTDSAEENINE